MEDCLIPATHLHERPLDLSVRRCTLAETSTTDSVNLIHEDDTGLMLSCVGEHLSDETSRLSDVLVDDLPLANRLAVRASHTHS
jgi:hypothetical protein